MHHPASRCQSGTALIITLALLFVMALVIGHANRHHVFGQQAAANQLRATQAFEAAEAGIDWAIAMLNDPRAVDAQCAAQPGAGPSFRERHLQADVATGMQRPTAGERAGCVRDAADWRCGCAAAPDSRDAAAPVDEPLPGFAIELTASARPGAVRLTSIGCSDWRDACPRTADADGRAQLQVTLGLVPGLARTPVAPLTTRDAVVSPAAIGLHNTDPAAAGIAVHAGGAVQAPLARVVGAAGSPVAAAVAEDDPALRALSGDRLFIAFFGMDKALWKEQPGVRRLACPGECGAALQAAIGPGPTHRMVWIEGDLQLTGPLSIGSRERPVLVAASGAVRLRGPVAIHGLVHAGSLAWHDAAAGTAQLRGAAISETGYAGDGAPDLIYDPEVLAALRTGTGSFVRLPGSWRDF